MDLENFMSGYICGVINVVVYLQWAQVYRVLTHLNSASETFLKNWAIKMECSFVTYFTVLMICSIFVSMWDHSEDNKD